MIHAVYTKRKPNHKWHLFSITPSAEKATTELQSAIQEAQKGGNEQGEAAIQVFDSIFFVPQILSEIKDQKVLGFN